MMGDGGSEPQLLVESEPRLAGMRIAQLPQAPNGWPSTQPSAVELSQTAKQEPWLQGLGDLNSWIIHFSWLSVRTLDDIEEPENKQDKEECFHGYDPLLFGETLVKPFASPCGAFPAIKA